MDRLLYIAMTGAKHSLLQQAVTANNLSNVSTTGYKSQNHAFRAVPVTMPGAPVRAAATDAAFRTMMAGAGTSTRTFVTDSTPNADLAPGAVRSTGRPLDIAVNGKGWIAVQDANGQEAYTRNGSLQVGIGGLLVTSNGLPVLGDGGPITVPEDSELTIGQDGTITVATNNQFNALTAIARIKLVNPPDDQMVRGDDGLFRSGQPAPADAAVTLAPAALEASNVNSVAELINIIDQSRFFDMQVKLMQKADENANRATQVMALNA